MTLHENEVPIDETVIRSLLEAQCPEWVGLSLSKAGAGKIQMNSKKLALRMAWSMELNEDSMAPIVGNYRRQSLRAMQNAMRLGAHGPGESTIAFFLAVDAVAPWRFGASAR